MKNGELKTVLIVDDTAANISIINALLRKHYRTQVALDGRSALELAGSDAPPDLILLDVMMPEMDGYQVCAGPQSRSRYPGDPRHLSHRHHGHR